VNVRGNFIYNRSLVGRLAGIETGERFAQSRVLQAQRRLYASRLFDRVYVNVSPGRANDSLIMDRPRESLDVRVDVSELPPRSLGLGAGVQLLPWRVLLAPEWEHLNVLGIGHSFSVGVSYSPVLSRNLLRDYRLNLNLAYRIPYLTRWEVNLATQPFVNWEYQLGRYELEYGAENGMSHDFSSNLSMTLANRLRRVQNSDTSATAAELPVQAITNALSVALAYDTRNDLFYPVRGGYLRPSVEVAGGWLGGSNDFYRFSCEIRYFRRFLLNHVLALRALTGAVVPYGVSHVVPYYEEFYLGGANSLRGYGEKAIGPVVTATDSHHYGDVLLNANAELRSPLVPINTSIVKGLGGALFLDGGNVFGSGGNYAFGKLQFAAGGGLRLNTPIGPVRLDYGKRLTEPTPGDWGRIYFGILNLF
jgi:outer membrane protein insertion porin family